MKPPMLWKDFKEEELFYPLLVNLPDSAALLQYSQAAVTEAELPDPAAFLTSQHPFPSALPKPFPDTWWRSFPEGNRGLSRFCSTDNNICAAKLASPPGTWSRVSLAGCGSPAVRQLPAVGKGLCLSSHDAGGQLYPAVPLELKKRKSQEKLLMMNFIKETVSEMEAEPVLGSVLSPPPPPCLLWGQVMFRLYCLASKWSTHLFTSYN